MRVRRWLHLAVADSTAGCGARSIQTFRAITLELAAEMTERCIRLVRTSRISGSKDLGIKEPIPRKAQNISERKDFRSCERKSRGGEQPQVVSEPKVCAECNRRKRGTRADGHPYPDSYAVANHRPEADLERSTCHIEMFSKDVFDRRGL